MALPEFRNSFAGRAAAVGLSAAVAFTPLTGALAQDASQAQPAVATSATVASATPVLLEDAGRAAVEWSLENEGIAVMVKMGTESGVTPAQISDVLTREINGAGVDSVAFFFEQNDIPATGVAYAYSGAVDGPFGLGEARSEAVRSAQQYLFQQSNPALAFSYNN